MQDACVKSICIKLYTPIYFTQFIVRLLQGQKVRRGHPSLLCGFLQFHSPFPAFSPSVYKHGDPFFFSEVEHVLWASSQQFSALTDVSNPFSLRDS